MRCFRKSDIVDSISKIGPTSFGAPVPRTVIKMVFRQLRYFQKRTAQFVCTLYATFTVHKATLSVPENIRSRRTLSSRATLRFRNDYNLGRVISHAPLADSLNAYNTLKILKR